MKLLSNKTRLLLLAIIAMMSTACKTVQQTAGTIVPNAVKDTALAQTSEPTVQLQAPTVAMLHHQWYSARINITINQLSTNKELMTLSAFFVNKKDSIIFLTISKMAIEGARIVLTPDSIKYANHLTGEYYWGDYSLLHKIIGFEVDFYLLQALFLAEDFPHFEANFLANSIEGGTIYHSTNRKSSSNRLSIDQEIKTNNQDKIVSNKIKELKTSTNLECLYGTYLNIGEQLCFHSMSIKIAKMNLLLNCSLKNIKINTPGPTSFRFPEKYKPIEK